MKVSRNQPANQIPPIRQIAPWLAKQLKCAAVLPVVLIGLLVGGCVPSPILLRPEQRTIVDRSIVEYPADYDLQLFATGLTAPTAITFDADGRLYLAEGGLNGADPHIFGFDPDGNRFDIYPIGRRVPIFKPGFRIYGPVGGLAVWQDRIYVSHRDANGRGMITAFDRSGQHETIVGDLPAQGEYSLTDMAINPVNERLYFGLGSATNSGVVGLDDFSTGWVQQYPHFHDIPFVNYRLTPARFTTRNPRGGLFGGPEIAVTSAFQPFGMAALRAPKSTVDRPTAAIYSVALSGGGLKVEAHGIRYPRGLAFNEFANLYATNQGMELRGTRPVKDDPDAVLRIVSGTWYGWPDYSTTLEEITAPRYQADLAMLIKTGYPELSFLIDHDASNLLQPSRYRKELLRGVFPSLSGASKMDFVTSQGAFSQYAGQVIVALWGDRAPFATSGQKLLGPVGRKLVRVDVEKKTTEDFIRNTRSTGTNYRGSAARFALQRPIDVKFDLSSSALYIVDMGQVQIKDGRESPVVGTGKILRLIPSGPNAIARQHDYDNPAYVGGKAHLQDHKK